MIGAYPLSWPAGYPRTKRPTSALFDTRFAVARDGLMNELRLMKARNVVLSSNLELRRDGLPYANQKQPDDKGVAVYFMWRGEQRVFACDTWNRIEDNVQALRKTIEALRGIGRWGVSDMLNRAFTGFVALPESTDGRTWWMRTLEIEPGATREEAAAAFRRLSKERHPDLGGTDEAMVELTAAIEAADALPAG